MKPITKVTFILGTKAQFIKSYPLLVNLNKKNIKLKIVDTCQHKNTTSTQLDTLGFEFEYKRISKNNEDIDSITKLIGWFLITVVKIIFSRADKERSICILHGDTASTLLGLIWAKKNKSTIFHIESGSRSGNIYKPFPEELIRLIVERFSHNLVCEYKFQIKNLDKYKLTKEIIFSGYPTIVDSIFDNISEELLLSNNNLKNNLIITIHRTENIYNQKNLLALIDLITEIKNNNYFHKIIWFCHPPTIKILKNNNYYEMLIAEGIAIKELLPYKDFLIEIYQSKCVLTDGGGVIQEASYLNIPLVVWRNKNKIDDQFRDNSNVLVSNYEIEKVYKFFKNLDLKERSFISKVKSPSEKISEEIINQMTSSTI